MPEGITNRKYLYRLVFILLLFIIEGLYFAELGRTLLAQRYVDDPYKLVLALVMVMAWILQARELRILLKEKEYVARKITYKLLLCHHDPELAFVISGVKLSVCARCFGYYLGAGVALLLIAFRSPLIFLIQQGWLSPLVFALILSMVTPVQGAYFRAQRLKKRKGQRFLAGFASGISIWPYVAAFMAFVLALFLG